MTQKLEHQGAMNDHVPGNPQEVVGIISRSCQQPVGGDVLDCSLEEIGVGLKMPAILIKSVLIDAPPDGSSKLCCCPWGMQRAGNGIPIE
jgi:hypothetical protein